MSAPPARAGGALDRVVVALDGMDLDQADAFLGRAQGAFPRVKVGLELFCARGPDAVRGLADRRGADVFLDLKLHDIPATVSGALRSLAGLAPSFVTVHLAGGRDMLAAALESAARHLPGTRLLGVGALTSLGADDLLEVHGETDPARQHARLLSLAIDAGLAGVVLSPLELPLLDRLERERGGARRLLRATPGVRFADEIGAGAVQDQRRVADPERALASGADLLVMGRSLTLAKDLPARTAELGGMTAAPSPAL